MTSKRKFPIDSIINVLEIQGRGREFETVWKEFRESTWESKESLRMNIPLLVERSLKVQNFCASKML